jgi:hypothetical protein
VTSKVARRDKQQGTFSQLTYHRQSWKGVATMVRKWPLGISLGNTIIFIENSTILRQANNQHF